MADSEKKTPGLELRPSETVQRILLSTTSRLVGEFADDDVLVTHAWPGMGDPNATHRWNEGPMSRSTYVLSFTTEAPLKNVGVVIPDYSPTGDRMAASMSVLFGKRFDSHGSLQNMGSFGLPNTTEFSTPVIASLPHNSHRPRPDISIPLNLIEMRRLNTFWGREHPDQEAVRVFMAAAGFYRRALQASEQDPEVAYLHLITAGEIISNAQFPSGKALLDPALEKLISQVEQNLADGPRMGRILRNRLYEVKKRFVASFTTYVDSDFFSRRESEDELSTFKKENFEKRISAAYDLRSQLVHSGQPFGRWVKPYRGNIEVQLGRPVVDDKEMRKILEWAPTLVGLERVTRYVLLKFMEARLDVDLAVAAETV